MLFFCDRRQIPLDRVFDVFFLFQADAFGSGESGGLL